MTLDLEALRRRIRAAGYPRATPEQTAIWSEDLLESRANLTIEGMCPTSEDEALFAMMLEEGISPTAMVEIIRGLYPPPGQPSDS